MLVEWRLGGLAAWQGKFRFKNIVRGGPLKLSDIMLGHFQSTKSVTLN